MRAVVMSWCRDGASLEALAAFFKDNITLSYISHSEIMSGRALDAKTWNPKIEAMFRDEIAERLDLPVDAPIRIATAHQDGKLISLAYVTFEKSVPHPYIIIEDVVVDRAIRGGGIGQAMMDWIFAQARSEGIERAFLESGQDNHDAHHFFERNGFHQTSIVMMAELGKPT